VPGEVLHACNPSTHEAEARGSQIQGQHGLRREPKINFKKLVWISLKIASLPPEIVDHKYYKRKN
jgi:hypothetical protein